MKAFKLLVWLSFIVLMLVHGQDVHEAAVNNAEPIIAEPATDIIDIIVPIDVKVDNTNDKIVAATNPETTSAIVNEFPDDLAAEQLDVTTAQTTMPAATEPNVAAVEQQQQITNNNVQHLDVTTIVAITTEQTTMPAATELNVATITNNMLNCYNCNSAQNQSCIVKPTKQIVCPGKGCYTLLKVEINEVLRGCITELTEEGHNYCQQHKQYCILCYETGCNQLKAPTAAAAATHAFYALILSIFCTFPHYYFN